MGHLTDRSVKDTMSNSHSLRNRLSHLTHKQALRLLRPGGLELLRQGGLLDIDIDSQTSLDNERFRLQLDGTRVEITATSRSLVASCSRCKSPCEHLGAALSLILEEKLALGLAAPPPERAAARPLSDEELVAQAIAERADRAASEPMRLSSSDPGTLWTDYLITNRTSGRSYKVALRGWEPGDSYCSCPDFRKNTLGTCKHILHALDKVKKRFPAEVRKRKYRQREIALHLRYGRTLELRLLLPARLSEDVKTLLEPLRDRAMDNLPDLLARLRQLQALGKEILIYPDAEEYLQRRLHRERLQSLAADIRRDPAHHPLRESLLKSELLPYQLDGIAFVAGAGRAVLADEMGLGKTIQGIGVAELLARESRIERVLVITPTSLKSQWRDEIARFCDRDCQLVIGGSAERAEQYTQSAFFTLCNYEQVLRDIDMIERQPWDLIILDEGQRIKNWQAKTSQTVKRLKSPFALVLTGTPLENRLDDLYSIIEFIDDRHLGPDFRFYNRHRVLDEKGRVLGYRNLDQLRAKLSPLLLRRTRDQVLGELPPRSTEILRIPPTQEQKDLHDGHQRTVSAIVNKRYLTEMDLLRLQKALLMCRLAANGTSLVDKQEPGYSSKLETLAELLDQLLAEPGRKIVLFSEWTSMLDLIEPLIDKSGADYVRLDGSVPQKRRHTLVRRFLQEPDCRLFLTTNAGSTGLNLQAANTVINVDLPWNPALLEQRIARAHRMGQTQPVQVYLLVTEDTLEENLLYTLSAKRELALAALDPSSDLNEVAVGGGLEELKRRLEVLLGAKPDAPLDESERGRIERQLAEERKQSVAAASGQLLTAALGLLRELLPPPDPRRQAAHAELLMEKLNQCVEEGGDGSLRLRVTLPDRAALNQLAHNLAGLIPEED